MKNITVHSSVYIKLFELTIKTYRKMESLKKLNFKQKQYHFQPDEFYCKGPVLLETDKHYPFRKSLNLK